MSKLNQQPSLIASGTFGELHNAILPGAAFVPKEFAKYVTHDGNAFIFTLRSCDVETATALDWFLALVRNPYAPNSLPHPIKDLHTVIRIVDGGGDLYSAYYMIGQIKQFSLNHKFILYFSYLLSAGVYFGLVDWSKHSNVSVAYDVHFFAQSHGVSTVDGRSGNSVSIHANVLTQFTSSRLGFHPVLMDEFCRRIKYLYSIRTKVIRKDPSTCWFDCTDITELVALGICQGVGSEIDLSSHHALRIARAKDEPESHWGKHLVSIYSNAPIFANGSLASAPDTSRD